MRPGGEKPWEVGGTSAPNTSCVQNTNEERTTRRQPIKASFHSLPFPLTAAQTESLTGGRDNKGLFLKAVFYMSALATVCENVQLFTDKLFNAP